MTSVVRILSFHAPYVCREQGACCTSDWPIAVEADRLEQARRAMASGRLTGSPEEYFEQVADEEAPALLVRHAGRCVFYDRRSRARCALHRALGHDALPLACRQFPRVSLLHPGGVSVTLSHYCPTAAALLIEPSGPVSIRTDAPGFPTTAEYVGLDARGSLPPLLRPDMLMDWAAWWRWEELSLAVIDQLPSPSAALQRLAAVVEVARRWSPSNGPLVAHIERAFESASAQAQTVSSESPDTSAAAPPILAARMARVTEVLESIPKPLRPSGVPMASAAPPPLVAQRRLLAAHAFANWTACLGLGLRTWLRSLEAVQALIDSGLGVRDADLWLRHLAEPTALAATWSRAEEHEREVRRGRKARRVRRGRGTN